MSAILSYMLSTSGLILFLIAVALLMIGGRARSAQRLLIGVTLFYLLASIYVVPFLVSKLLTRNYRPLQATDVIPEEPVIVLLGGGDMFIHGWSDSITITTPIEAARIIEARRVFALLPSAWIVSSGGRSEFANEHAQPSSIVMRDELIRLGVPGERILLESTSISTYDEAALVAGMLRSRHPRQVVLVTSDIHMLRSMGAFRSVGLNPVAAIAPDPQRPTSRSSWLLPTARGLDMTSELVHEVIGFGYYWLRGWWR